jgi:hypothetical protein
MADIKLLYEIFKIEKEKEPDYGHILFRKTEEIS